MSMRDTEPKVWHVLATIETDACGRKLAAHHHHILHVIADGMAHLCHPLGRIDGGRCTLGDIADAIETDALAVIPQTVHRDAAPIQRLHLQLVRDDRIATTKAGETCRAREAAQLDGYLLGAAYLVDGMRDAGRLDVCLVSGIEKDERMVLQRIVHPPLQARLAESHACGIVGRAEINHIDRMVRRLRYETVGFHTFQIVDIAPMPSTEDTRPARNHIALHINGIDRVCYADGIVVT